MLRLPAARPEATFVKKRKATGSTGWLASLGIVSRMNSRTDERGALHPSRMRNELSRRPMNRLPRWMAAPRMAPMAAPKMPSVPPNATVPATIPAL